MNLESIQRELQKTGLDGWLFFDHHERDPLVYRVLGLKPSDLVSRRWYFFISARGEPRGLVHQVEPHVLAACERRLKSAAGVARVTGLGTASCGTFDNLKDVRRYGTLE